MTSLAAASCCEQPEHSRSLAQRALSKAQPLHSASSGKALTQMRLANRRCRDGHKPGSTPVAHLHQPDSYRSELSPTHPPSVEQIASTYLTIPGLPSSCKVVLTKFTPWCVVESGGYAVMIASLVGLERSGSNSNLVMTKLGLVSTSDLCRRAEDAHWPNWFLATLARSPIIWAICVSTKLSEVARSPLVHLRVAGLLTTG